MTDDGNKCSFCGKGPQEVSRVVAGLTASICNECLKLCGDIALSEFRDPATAGRNPSLVCSFCGQDNRRWLVAGPRVYICDECADTLQTSN